MQGQPEYSGGCQCGAIRFQVRGALTDSSICHCRMCQKAFGAYYAPLVSVRGVQFSWTRGQPRYFQSSNVVRRGLCRLRHAAELRGAGRCGGGGRCL